MSAQVYDWDSVPWGQLSIREVALMTGAHPSTVRYHAAVNQLPLRRERTHPDQMPTPEQLVGAWQGTVMATARALGIAGSAAHALALDAVELGLLEDYRPITRDGRRSARASYRLTDAGRREALWLAS